MEPAQAAAQLETIRTLMERASLYRRALAPITLAVGALGVAGGALALGLPLNSLRGFAGVWGGTAVAALIAAFLVARRQSLQAAEPFWTPPTRRIFHALVPALVLGGALIVLVLARAPDPTAPNPATLLATAWVGIYGLGLNAAGFFMPRGIRWFGIGFTLVAATLILTVDFLPRLNDRIAEAHWLMTITFGFGHLAYGLYLRATERSLSPVRS